MTLKYIYRVKRSFRYYTIYRRSHPISDSLSLRLSFYQYISVPFSFFWNFNMGNLRDWPIRWSSEPLKMSKPTLSRSKEAKSASNANRFITNMHSEFFRSTTYWYGTYWLNRCSTPVVSLTKNSLNIQSHYIIFSTIYFSPYFDFFNVGYQSEKNWFASNSKWFSLKKKPI